MRTRTVKLLLSAVAVVFAAVGIAAIVFESHTGMARRVGMVSLSGERAVEAGLMLLLLAALPLAVWLPRRALAPTLLLWWLGVMAWLGWIVFGR